MNKSLIAFFIFLSLQLFAQKSNEELETKIKNLNDSIEIQNYWIELHKSDQSVRGKVTELQARTDLENIKKVFLMFKYHGYPSNFCYGCGNNSNLNFTPLIIMTHNTVKEINFMLFPYIKTAYEKGLANEFWYIHVIRGMVRATYGRDFYEKTPENTPLFYQKIAPLLNNDKELSLELIDSLYLNYNHQLNNILTSEIIYKEKVKEVRNKIYKTPEGKLYWLKMYRDKSFNFPVEIYYKKEENCFYYTIDKEKINNGVIDNLLISINQLHLLQ